MFVEHQDGPLGAEVSTIPYADDMIEVRRICATHEETDGLQSDFTTEVDQRGVLPVVTKDRLASAQVEHQRGLLFGSLPQKSCDPLMQVCWLGAFRLHRTAGRVRSIDLRQ